MHSFRYEPLPSAETWIRILVLQRGNGDDSLRAEIVTCSLDRKPIFDAISYCWGDAQKPREISLKHENVDYSFAVTESLYLALRRFRSSTESCSLWTDAICINQSDHEEKGHQIRLMDWIYTNARKVLIYLGEPDKTTPKALKLINKIHTAVVQTPDEDKRSPKQWISDNKLPLLNAQESWKWNSLREFFRRPWFRRKWIIQECALARQPVFHLGSWERDWDYMAIVIKAISEKSLGIVDYTESVSLEEADKTQQGLVQSGNLAYLRSILPNNIKPTLMWLLSMFEASRASDSRDHIFALLSLASDASNEALNPRYDRTVLQTCLTYATHFLRSQGDLEVLYRAGLRGQRLLAPSWVPDWYGGHEGAGFEVNNGIWDPLLRPGVYNIAHGTCPNFVDTEEETVIGLRGMRIDVVRELANEGLVRSRAILDKDAIIAQKRRHLEQSDQIVSRIGTYPTGGEQAFSDIQWRTLICNVTRDLQQAPESYRASYEAYRRVVLIGQEDQSTKNDVQLLQPFRQAIDYHNGDKIFGLTDSGYVGMFPQLAEEGDVIAVLDGGDFPFVLRSSATADDLDNELVGQCYIHGMMEVGQLDLSNPQFVRQDFFLGRAFLPSIRDPRSYKQAVRAMRNFRC